MLTRPNLFQNAEKGFDKLFDYDRQLTESFEYCNTMKNGSISDQLKMQELQISRERKNKQENKQVTNTENEMKNQQAMKEKEQIAIQKEKNPKRGIRR